MPLLLRQRREHGAIGKKESSTLLTVLSVTGSCPSVPASSSASAMITSKPNQCSKPRDVSCPDFLPPKQLLAFLSKLIERYDGARSDRTHQQHTTTHHKAAVNTNYRAQELGVWACSGKPIWRKRSSLADRMHTHRFISRPRRRGSVLSTSTCCCILLITCDACTWRKAFVLESMHII